MGPLWLVEFAAAAAPVKKDRPSGQPSDNARRSSKARQPEGVRHNDMQVTRRAAPTLYHTISSEWIQYGAFRKGDTKNLCFLLLQ